MKRVPVATLALGIAFAAPAFAANPTITAGGGGSPNIVESGRNVCWSEPADFEGLIASSEVIGQFGLETEIANDFILTTDTVITLARWWGGYYNNNSCQDSHVAPTWNLRFFDDGGCVPVNMLAEYVIPDYAGETLVYCQGGFYPIFRYEGAVSFPATANMRYWFVAQAGDHVFPPQVGRVAASSLTDCDSMFRSIYFSYPDWYYENWGWVYDASQEFECGETPTKGATWGAVKALYR
jgi:hypothetical protein